jgi:hypothetical protein
MKKWIMIFGLSVLIGYSASAQKLDNSKVPASVKSSFAKYFPGATARWIKEGDHYEAEFRQNGSDMSALFEPNGNITEKEMDIQINELPPPVLIYINEHYKGKKIKEAAKIARADGTIFYEAEVEGMDIIFDSGGKFIKEIKK